MILTSRPRGRVLKGSRWGMSQEGKTSPVPHLATEVTCTRSGPADVLEVSLNYVWEQERGAALPRRAALLSPMPSLPTARSEEDRWCMCPWTRPAPSWMRGARLSSEVCCGLEPLPDRPLLPRDPADVSWVPGGPAASGSPVTSQQRPGWKDS